jgi:hypothetical protein
VSSMRRAALKLHSLSEADRQWMMAHLPPETSARLKPLLNEITDLGFPAGVPDLAAPGDRRPSTTEEAPAPAALKLEEIGAVRLARMLRSEPAAVIAAVLDLSGAPERAEVLSRIDDRRNIAAALRTPARRLAPKFAASLRAAVEVQAKHMPANAPPMRGRGARQLVMRWIERVAIWK